MSSSYVGELARYWTPLPMLAMALPSLLSSLVALRLPETKGQALPESMEEAYELNANTVKYYSSMYEILE